MSCFTYTNLVDQASALNPDPNPYPYRSPATIHRYIPYEPILPPHP